jgi:hypothetical protein
MERGSVSACAAAAGVRLPGVARCWQSTFGLLSDALIELVLRCRLGVAVDGARPGVLHVP